MSKMKKTLSLMLALSLTVSAFVVSPRTVEAKTVTYSIENVTDLGTGNTVTKTWTNKDHKEAYFSFTLKKNGYASFSITKPVVDGLKHEERVAVLNQNGHEVWVGDTKAIEDWNAASASFKVGLKKGSYYLCIQPQSLTVMSWQSAQTDVSLTTKADANFETESNNTKKTANALKVGKAMKASFCEEYDVEDIKSDKVYEDWFKVRVKKGTTYKVTLKNNKKLKANGRNTLCHVYNNNKIVDRTTLMKKGSYTFKASKNGYYYIRVWNDSQHKSADYQIKVEKKKK